ncbi:ABC transporter ATP-binding protein [Bacteroidota bacterium]
MSTILSVNNLTKHYGNINAVQDLSFHIEKGQVYGILGPNGSGKTTTLSIITGIVKQNNGSFSWFEKGNHKSHRLKIGSFIESPYFYPYLSLYKNLEIICLTKNINTSEINNVLGITTLLKRKHSRYESLSKGMKQRLGLAAAILGDPEVLVLDEPTSSLDPEGIADVREIIIGQAKQGKTLILASHILDEVEKVCSHAGILKNGQLIASGAVNQLLKKQDKIIISSTDNDKLGDVLKNALFIETIEFVNDEYNIILQQGYGAVDLNKFAYDNGIILSKIITEKPNLESQFLELVK